MPLNMKESDIRPGSKVRLMGSGPVMTVAHFLKESLRSGRRMVACVWFIPGHRTARYGKFPLSVLEPAE